jgi:hypothetical protein
VQPAPLIPDLTVSVVDGDGRPVEGARVLFGDLDQVSTGGDGKAAAPWPRQPISIEVSAPGYETGNLAVQELPDGRLVTLPLQPLVLTGRVVDQAGAGLYGAVVHLGDVIAVTGDGGHFEIVKPIGEEIVVSKAAYDATGQDWDGTTLDVELALEPLMIRSLRASGPVVADIDRWNELLQLAADTEINAIVVDTKNEEGVVFPSTSINQAYDIEAVTAVYDQREIVDDLHSRGLYAITRIVTFQDDNLARSQPDLAIWDAGRNAVWETDGGQAWLDPTDRQAWEYPLALAEEACESGFDEIQFDYVRFPTDGAVDRAVFDGAADQAGRVETIAAFLSEARRRLNPAGCAVAADIFSVVLSADGDQGLGQKVEDLSRAVDVVSPMIYPSHYSTGWFGFDCPNDHPSEVVAAALSDGLPRMSGPVIVRPWLQDFSFGCGASYDAGMVRSEIEAAEAHGLGWLLWNARSRFTVGALEPAE